jgi:uncharacterized membrane protein (UPF0127 family)
MISSFRDTGSVRLPPRRAFTTPANRLRGGVLAVALISGIACGQRATHSGPPTGTLFLGPERVALQVQIAETEPARQKGLMGRKTLAPDAGMAFLFDSPVRVAFYMKDTLIPLSIAFWDRDSRIVTILDMTPCPADSCPNYYAQRAFVGAVEANQGFFAEHGIGIGDTVELER